MTWNLWLLPPIITSIFFDLGIILCFELAVKTIMNHQIDRQDHYKNNDRAISVFTAAYFSVIYIFVAYLAWTTQQQLAFMNFRLVLLFLIALFLQIKISSVIVVLAIISEFITASALTPRVFLQAATILLVVLVLVYIHYRIPSNAYSKRSIFILLPGLIFWIVLAISGALTWSLALQHSLEYILMVTVIFWALVKLGRENELAMLNSRYAKYDGLTGARNFHFFTKDFHDCVQTAQSNDQNLSMITIDIDHFKVINDTYGHLAGDLVLSQVTKKLIQVVNSYSDNIFVYRVGGEEFNLLLPGEKLTKAIQVSLACRRAVEEMALLYDKQTLTVTISVGVADLQPGDTSFELYDRADQNLYLSKGRGRNRVTVNSKTLRA